MLIKHLLKQGAKTLSSVACRNKQEPLSVVFYGSDVFSIPSLKQLHRNCLSEGKTSALLKRLTVVTGVSKHITLPLFSLNYLSDYRVNNVVANYAKLNKLEFELWPYEPATTQFDLGVVVSFGHLIPLSAIEKCRYGFLNVHGSLLPRWRGAAPIPYAILHGDQKSGITIMKIKPHKFDVGEIVLQEEIEIDEIITAIQLRETLADIGSVLLLECLRDLETCLSKSRPQPKEGVTLARKLRKEDGLLNWAQMTSVDINRRFRAFYGFIDVYTYWIDGRELLFHDCVILPDVTQCELDNHLIKHSYDKESLKPGCLFYHKKRRALCIKCADNRWLAFSCVNLRGRKRLKASEFYNGFVSRLYQQKCLVILGEKHESIL